MLYFSVLTNGVAQLRHHLIICCMCSGIAESKKMCAPRPLKIFRGYMLVI